MTIFYSKTTNGFYDTLINGRDIPDDAREISPQRHAALMVEQTQGKVIVADDNGLPCARTQEFSLEDQSSYARAKRDALLHDCDWVVLRGLERGVKPPEQWVVYRRALRDIPEQAGFPQEIVWPEAPDVQGDPSH